MKFGPYLKSLREAAGKTKRDLAKSVAVTGNYIGLVEAGKRKPPTIALCEKISLELGLSSRDKEHLLNLARVERSPLESRALVNRALMRQKGIDVAEFSEDVAEFDRVPELGVCPASPKQWVDDEIEAWHYLPKHLTHGRRLYILKVRGDSMNKAGIEEGDLLLIDADAQPANGRIVVICIDSEYTIKRFFKNGDQITLMPDSTNPNHKPAFFTAKNDLRLRGIVDKIYMKEPR